MAPKKKAMVAVKVSPRREQRSVVICTDHGEGISALAAVTARWKEGNGLVVEAKTAILDSVFCKVAVDRGCARINRISKTAYINKLATTHRLLPDSASG